MQTEITKSQMEILHQDKYKIIHLWDGSKLKDSVDLINKKKANGINLNFTRNFPSNLNQLEKVKDIKSIQINGAPGDFDYSVINQLHTLENLSVYTTDKKEINFNLYPHLESCAIYWRPKAKSLFECANLKSLFIGKYTGADLSQFSRLKNLKYLRINM
jgi:hypothetical protein